MKHIVIFFTAILFVACHKKYDLPPLTQANEGARVSVQNLKQRCTTANSFYHFAGGDTNLVCTVTMDETSGNIYKQVYVRDDNGDAMLLQLISTGGLFAGDRLRINLNGLWLISAASMVYIDSVDLEKSVVKISSGNRVTPVATTIQKILSGTDPRNSSSLQSQLVELSNVEFVYAARNKPFANAVTKAAGEYNLTDCAGKTITVRSSGLCNFASKSVPAGNGKLVAVVEQYNNGMTLLIRNYNELQMQNTPCTGPPPDTSGTRYLFKDFNDNSISSGGWTIAAVTGTTAWTPSNIGQASSYARIYNKNNSIYEACENWLISPVIDLTSASQPALSFLTANSSTASPLSLMISEDYNLGSAATAHWTELSFTFTKNSFTYCASGDVAIAPYKGKKVRIAFKYTGTNTSGSIWDVDDVLIAEKK